MLKQSITAIPDKKNFGKLERLASYKGKLIDWFVKLHDAKRSGRHLDYRLGTPNTGLFSWASRKELPTESGQGRSWFRQPLHTFANGAWEGYIGKGYGAGKVTLQDKGKLLVTTVKPNRISFTLAHRKYPERFTLVKGKGGTNQWYLINVTPSVPIEFKKQHYIKVPEAEAEKLFRPGMSIAAKIDGAAAFLKIMKDKVEIVSYRSNKAGKPIVHTERVFHDIPKLDIPKEDVGKVLRGELYGTKPKQPELSGYQPTLSRIRSAGIRYVIGAGYGLRGHRKVNDLDILVHEDDWDKLANTGAKQEKSKYGTDKFVINTRAGEIEFFKEGYPPGFSYKTLEPEGYDTDEFGNQVWTTDQTKRWKAAMGRPKDLKDLETLDSIPTRQKVIPSRELGGLLNSSVARSMKTQKDNKVKIKMQLFNIMGSDKPFSEKQNILNRIKGYLPSNISVAKQVTDPEKQRALFEQIKAKKHPMTTEGIVATPEQGTPYKVKFYDPYRVWVREIFPRVNGPKAGKTAGGFSYSWDPEGPVVGKIGTGFSQDMLKSMWDHPDDWLNRMALVEAEEKFPSGALRGAAFKNLHEDY
jgi:hypothetical protein